MAREGLCLRPGYDNVRLVPYLLEGANEFSGVARPAILICPGASYLYCSK